MKFVRFILLLIIFLTHDTLGSRYVLLISFDGFRWDYLNRSLTPNLNNFADKGIRALSLEPAYPSGTFPNHYTIVTGMYPENHGIIGNHIYDKFTNNSFTLRKQEEVSNPRWYLGEAIWETAKRQGILTASFFWPGSELNLDYRRPDYFVPFNPKIPYKTRIDSVIGWLKLPYEKRPKFITLYFEETDTKGHDFGPFSPEIDSAIVLCDQLFGYLLDQLRQINFLDSINIIVVSDHGMTEIDKNKIIVLKNYLGIGKIEVNSYGYLCSITGEKDSVEKAYNTLKNNERNFKVYKRKEVPNYFHFNNNPWIGEVIVIPEIGWTVAYDSTEYTFKVKATHGFDNHWLDMHGIFIAKGPALKNGYTTGTLMNIDIYPLMCKILNIIPRNNIDGKLERIEYILK
ncbi:alkaline phosphatase family protein [Bacteroidetes/Chlorobi group bacterium Naka2016]|jgi:predicted AlkP superfamily pyrophosphatase or phosphodiesterase|nr:MAG: alkaline phosphatase family protein [Bacteroidetes/Chlorobi group bacterium Naka2016]